ncbi:unnamed protein product [Brachionus calyciflorus]|uniref:Integrase zinc-binding domain-containing protein n=1 Tax=Brachionus calyciflorus TaxID=104777 RepID=A0A814J1A6_9BILA|nr:unnamed protein product [Brachionus calyciflorus]
MYEFDIEYRQGHENGNADALSRWLLEEEESETETFPDPGFVVNKVILQGVEFNENQLEDEAIAALYSWVRKGGRPVQCEKTDPELYEDDGIRFQYVVPKSDRQAVLKKVHDDPLGGHLGVDKTTDKLKILLAKLSQGYCQIYTALRTDSELAVADTVEPVHEKQVEIDHENCSTDKVLDTGQSGAESVEVKSSIEKSNTDADFEPNYYLEKQIESALRADLLAGEEASQRRPQRSRKGPDRLTYF